MSKPVSKGGSPTPAAKKPAAGARAAKKSPPKVESAPPPRASKNILSAGIKALTSVHEEAVARQSRVFESLLGLGPRPAATPAAPEAATTLDPFGFKKFEDVFDQRVARALQHLGVPTAEAVSRLTEEVERLRETVAKLEAQGRKR